MQTEKHEELVNLNNDIKSTQCTGLSTIQSSYIYIYITCNHKTLARNMNTILFLLDIIAPENRSQAYIEAEVYTQLMCKLVVERN